MGKLNKAQLNLYKGFCEYIIQHTGTFENARTDASSLLSEIKRCLKREKNLSSFWRMLAVRLFEKMNIKDERIQEGEILREVSFKRDGKEFKSKILYYPFDVETFPKGGFMCHNTDSVDEKEFILKSIERNVSRRPDTDTDEIYVTQNYVLFLQKDYGKI